MQWSILYRRTSQGEKICVMENNKLASLITVIVDNGNMPQRSDKAGQIPKG